MSKIKVKRIIPIYTIVTDKFKTDLEEGTSLELKLVDDQSAAIHNQIKQLQSRFGLLKNQATQQSQDQINRAIIELTERFEQLQNLKQTMLTTMNDMKNKPNGSEVQTGFIENYVDIEVGSNMKDIFERAKIVIKDDIVQEIID